MSYHRERHHFITKAPLAGKLGPLRALLPPLPSTSLLLSPVSYLLGLIVFDYSSFIHQMGLNIMTVALGPTTLQWWRWPSSSRSILEN